MNTHLDGTAAGLVVLDDAYDHAFASDGISRLGAYLRRDRWLSAPEGDLEPVGFAAAVWRIATPPVMAPGYVRIRRDLTAVTAHPSDGIPDLLVVTVHVPIGWPRGRNTHPAARGWRGWIRPRSFDDGPDAYHDPDEDRPALLTTARLRLPIPAGDLPVPGRDRGGAVDLRAAKSACSVIAAHINAAGPLLAVLREVPR
jgi:hypothetical protein